MNVFGGPYAGKSTLHKALMKEGIPVTETDTQRGSIPGFREELWTAWRQNHPLHKEWSAFNVTHHKAMLEAARRGDITITHDPLEGWDGMRLEIRPSEEALAERKKEDGRPSRIDAADHYYAKPRRAADARVTTVDTALRFIKQMRKSLAEEESTKMTNDATWTEKGDNVVGRGQNPDGTYLYVKAEKGQSVEQAMADEKGKHPEVKGWETANPHVLEATPSSPPSEPKEVKLEIPSPEIPKPEPVIQAPSNAADQTPKPAAAARPVNQSRLEEYL